MANQLLPIFNREGAFLMNVRRKECVRLTKDEAKVREFPNSIEEGDNELFLCN